MAIPGSVVGVGKLVTPGGAQGPLGGTGPPGPNVVSADAGNIAVLGSDNLIMVPQSTIWNQRLRSFNAIGNPNFEVDQRNVGSLVANPVNGSFALDGFVINKAGSMVISSQQLPQSLAGPGPTVPGTNFRISSNFLMLTLTTPEATLAAGDLWSVTQSIEGPRFREIAGDVSSISLLVASSVPGLKFSVAIRDPGSSTKSLVKLCTIPSAAAWTLIQLPNLPNFPSGNFSLTPGTSGYQVSIVLACGTTFTALAADTWQSGNFLGAPGMSNFAASPVNSTFQVAFVQHEPGPLCTTLMDKPFAGANGNLEECLRYYQKTYSYGTVAGTPGIIGGRSLISLPAGTPAAYGPTSFYKPMAKAPTVTIYNHSTGAANSVQDGYGVNHASATAGSPGDSGFYTISFATAPSGIGSIFFHYTADTGW